MYRLAILLIVACSHPAPPAKPAAKQKLTFEAIREDIHKYDFGTNKWDLVTMTYAGSNPKVIERVKPSIKKGGLFVVEFFHKEATAVGSRPASSQSSSATAGRS